MMETLLFALLWPGFSLTAAISGEPFNAGMQKKPPPAEYAGLIDFYYSTNSVGRSNHTDWLNENATNWFGVTVSQETYDDEGILIGLGNVVSIGSELNQLRGAIAPHATLAYSIRKLRAIVDPTSAVCILSRFTH